MIMKKPDRIERSMELALKPGSFIDHGESWGFVEGLDRVEEEIGRLVKSRPGRAVELLETFIAGCYEKAEEIDDSSGSFGQFVEVLFCTWIKARHGAKADSRDTVKQLLNWMGDDNHGFCYGIEKNAVKVFNKAGVNAFGEIAHAEWTKELIKVQVQEKGDKMTPGSFRLRWLWNVLRAIYVEQRDAERYLAVAEEMGLTPRDCEALAEIYEKRGKAEEALTWVDRGLYLEKDGRWPDDSSWGLPDRKRKLLNHLGRGKDALISAWNEFQEHPSKYAYETLIKYVPRGQQSEWHAKVLKVAEEADLSHAIELYVETKEWARLAQLVREAKPAALEGLSHYTTEPAAKKLERMDPEAAIRNGLQRLSVSGFQVCTGDESKILEDYIERWMNEQTRVSQDLDRAVRGN